MKVEKIDHVHACVKDLDGAIALFRDVFGVDFDPVIELSDTWGVRDVRGPLGIDLIEVTDPEAKTVKEMGHLFRDGICAVSLKVPDMKLNIPLGILPVNSTANQEMKVTTMAARATKYSTTMWGMTRSRRKNVVSRDIFSGYSADMLIG